MRWSTVLLQDSLPQCPRRLHPGNEGLQDNPFIRSCSKFVLDGVKPSDATAPKTICLSGFLHLQMVY